MFEQGTIALGVNYWASHAATKMWTQWDEKIVENDLLALSGLGIKLLRVFPIWPDFQPLMVLRIHCTKGGFPRAYAFTGERPLPVTEAGQAGVDETMMERFERLCDLAEKYNLKVIVPLINGHMTYRVYLPPALDGIDTFTDPEAIMWQIKFVRYFVRRMKHHPAILAWELGNESNCMSCAETRAAAWSWTAIISDAVKSQDTERLLMSGMHSLQLHDMRKPNSINSSKNKWLIKDQAENCDMLTTHPYSMWRSYVNCDQSNSLRWVMLATTENTLYSNISGKLSIVEEIGTLRRTFSDFSSLGRQLNNILWLLWANDARALLWWCSFDQTSLEFPPYDWDEAGMEHGIMQCDYTLNPTGKAITEFAGFIDSLPISSLPLQKDDGVCILGREQDHYELVNATNILAKQAGINLRFAFCEDQLPDSQLYIIPCAKRKGGLNRAAYRELSRRMKAGATVYMSLDYDTSIPEMTEFLGVEIIGREKNKTNKIIKLDLEGETLVIPFNPEHDFKTVGCGAEPMDDAGVFWEYRRGKGRIVVAMLPLEMLMLKMAQSFQNYPVYKLYRYLGKTVLSDKIIVCNSPELIISEHSVDENLRYAIAVNCSRDNLEETLILDNKWKIVEYFSNDHNSFVKEYKLTVPANAGILIKITRSQV